VFVAFSVPSWASVCVANAMEGPATEQFSYFQSSCKPPFFWYFINSPYSAISYLWNSEKAEYQVKKYFLLLVTDDFVLQYAVTDIRTSQH
jgi:hypothetical protein